MAVLVTICARSGSKGLSGKNLKIINGLPLLAHSIQHAKKWKHTSKVVVSTDSEDYKKIAAEYGAEAPFTRPGDLASDTAGKVPVIAHALIESEKHFGLTFDTVLDLDVSAPLRTEKDIENGYQQFISSGADVCFSVTKARRNPYFNMVERDAAGHVSLSKVPGKNVLSRQATPEVWDLNASIYFYKREYLLKSPAGLWDGKTEIFEMPEETVFDINDQLDFEIVQLIMDKRKISH